MLQKMWQAPHSWHTLPISHRILYCLSWIWLQNPLNSVLWGANTKRSEQTHDFKLTFIEKRIHRAYSRKLVGSEVATANAYQYPIPNTHVHLFSPGHIFLTCLHLQPGDFEFWPMHHK